MKYIFVAGAPGSKWSSVVKNIYHSESIDRSDYSDARTYYHNASGNLELMHMGAYFDPGMEFDLPEDLTTLPKEQVEQLFDRPFSGKGVRIVKSHIFSRAENIKYLKKTWPDCPLVLVHRNNDACLGWWVKCGHFDITYPDYSGYYQNLKIMAEKIKEQNQGILDAWWQHRGQIPDDNKQLATFLKIDPPPSNYVQDYPVHDVRVMVI